MVGKGTRSFEPDLIPARQPSRLALPQRGAATVTPKIRIKRIWCVVPTHSTMLYETCVASESSRSSGTFWTTISS